MVYYLTHAEHGRMPVYDKGEIERMAKFGWSLEGSVVGVIVPGIDPAQSPPVAPALAVVPEVQRKKPGPKPKAK